MNWNPISTAYKYKVRYRPTGTNTWTTVSTVNNYKKLKDLTPLTQYDWQVKSLCTDAGLGKSEWSSTQSFTTLSLKIDEELFNEELSVVYPNPASPDQSGLVTIRIIVSNTSEVEISLYDLKGRKIRTIADDSIHTGDHSINFSVKDLQKGIYLMNLKAKDSMSSQKLVVQ